MTDFTKCIRCDEPVSTNPGEWDGLTLAFNQETGFVKVCDDCKDVVKGRDIYD